MYIHIYIYIDIRMYTCTFMYMYIYIYIHIYMYVQNYTQTYTDRYKQTNVCVNLLLPKRRQQQQRREPPPLQDQRRLRVWLLLYTHLMPGVCHECVRVCVLCVWESKRSPIYGIANNHPFMGHLRVTASHYNTLQHPITHCNTLNTCWVGASQKKHPFLWLVDYSLLPTCTWCVWWACACVHVCVVSVRESKRWPIHGTRWRVTAGYVQLDACCNTLQHPATHCNTLQHTATRVTPWYVQLVSITCVKSLFSYVQYDLQHTATHCNTLQHTATHCNILQHIAPHCTKLPYAAPHYTTLQHVANQCNTLQHLITHCNALQHTATYHNTLQHPATHCNTLQYNATHCNTLQHPATHFAYL